MSKRNRGEAAAETGAGNSTAEASQPEMEGRADVTVTANGDAIYTPNRLEQARAARQKADPNETKFQKFRRLATRRMNKALKAVRDLIPLANRAAYEYGQSEVDQVKAALTEAVSDVGRAFANVRQEPVGFQLR